MMIKTSSLALAILISAIAHSQVAYLVLKRKNKIIRYYWQDSRITFQAKNAQWVYGVITKIEKDSFYLTPEYVRYTLYGSDTVHYQSYKLGLQDIWTLPSKKQSIVHQNDQVRVILGHEKFAWVRNGLIFQIGGAGYAGLNIMNDLISHSPPFSKKKRTGLGIAAGVYLIGTIMHRKFDPQIHLGHKYHIEAVILSPVQRSNT